MEEIKSLSLRPFRAGTVFNKLQFSFHKAPTVRYRFVRIAFPSRLNAMAIDPSRIVISKHARYSAGEVVFSVRLPRVVTVRVRRDEDVRIDSRVARPALVLHAARIMRRALNVRHGYDIRVHGGPNIPHAGLGSSSNLIASVAVAIHEVYGAPIPPSYLVKYFAQNHGEEISGKDDRLYPVQCLGGSAAAGLCGGGLLVLAGESDVIARMEIPNQYVAVIGVPKDYIPPDAKTLMDLEIKHMSGFIRAGKRFGHRIAYAVLHRMLPAMAEKDIVGIGDVIFEYRFGMGSIRNCSYAYPRIISRMNSLAYLKYSGVAQVLSISSVGPGAFAITKHPAVCMGAFEKAGFTARKIALDNDGYKVLKRQCC